MRVFLTHNSEDLDAYYGRALRELRTIADVTTNPYQRDLTTAELIEAAAGCDVIIAHRSTPGEQSLFEARGELVAFLRTAVDISTIDVAAASAAGILVGRADKSFVVSTAELALALTLDVLRNVSESTADYRAGREPPQRIGVQLCGRTAGVIGYGDIGRRARHVAAGARGAPSSCTIRTWIRPPTASSPPRSSNSSNAPTSCSRSRRRLPTRSTSSTARRSRRCGPARYSSTCRAASCSTRTRWRLPTTPDGSAGWPWTSGRHRTNARHLHSQVAREWSPHRTWVGSRPTTPTPRPAARWSRCER